VSRLPGTVLAAWAGVLALCLANACAFDFDSPFSEAVAPSADGSAGSGATNSGGNGGSDGGSGSGGDASVDTGGAGGATGGYGGVGGSGAYGGTGGAGGFGGASGTGGTGGAGGFGGASGTGGTGGTGGSGGTATGGAGGFGGTGAGGTGGCDVGASWTQYDFSFQSGTWSSAPLCELWTGSNAPPPFGIAAAEQLSDFDRLIVVTDDSTVYIREAGMWLPPTPAAQLFPGLASVDAIYHIPHAWTVHWDPTAPFEESLTIMSRPDYRIYSYRDDNSVSFTESGVMVDEALPGPQQATSRCYWSFNILDLSQVGEPGAYLFYFEYDDGYVYVANAAFEWSRWSVAQSPLWAGKLGAPTPGTVRAAWYEQNTAIAKFVAY